MPAPPPFRAALDHLDRLEEHAAVFLLVAMSALVAVQVAARFLFGLGFSWMEELARLAFVWVVFLGAVVGMRRCLHIRVEAGISALPAALRPWVVAVGDMVTLLFCAAMTWHGLELVQSTLRFAFNMPATGMSMFWAYLIMPVSFGLQVVRLAVTIATGQREARNV